MATITTTTTNNTCRSAFRPTFAPVGAEPPRRTIAHGVGSHNKPDTSTDLQTTVIPAKAGIQRSPRVRSPRFARDDTFPDRSGTSHCHCEGAERLWQSHRSGSRSRPEPTQDTPRPLLTSAPSASNEKNLRPATCHCESAKQPWQSRRRKSPQRYATSTVPNKKNSAPSAALSDLCVQTERTV